MGSFTLSRNARVLIDEQPYRMLKQIDDGYWQLEHEKTGRLAEKATWDLLNMLREGRLRYVGDPSSPHSDPLAPIESNGERKVRYRCVWEAASIFEQKIARAKFCYVKALLELPKNKSARREVIAKVAHREREAALKEDEPPHRLFKSPPSVSTTDRWETLYIRGDRDIAALLPRHKNRGNRNPRFSDELAQIVDGAIDDVFLQPERPTLQDTTDEAISRVAKANKLRSKHEHLPLPTGRMVRSLLRKRDPIDICTARYGAHYARHKYRLVLKGNMVTEGLRRAEIDHTPMNVLVIDDRSFLPLGRPWLTLIVDVAHRVILGYALSFEPPSYLSVMRCIRHAILPKTYLKAQYPELQNDWPFFGLMDTLGLDNGADFHSNGLYDLASRYGIDLDFCEVRTPWMKGIIERLQGTINRGVAHGQPGTLFEDLIERGDYNSASKACITLEDLHRIIHIWIVDYYHQRRHRSLGMTPHESWTREMQHREIPLPTSAVELDQALSVRFTRTLTHKGVELDHLFYNSPVLPLMQIRLYSLARWRICRLAWTCGEERPRLNGIRACMQALMGWVRV